MVGVVLTLRTPLALLAVLMAGLAAAPAAPAATERPGALEMVLQDDAQLLHRPEPELRASLERLRSLGVDRVRISANWSVLTRDASSEQRPADFDAADPAAYEQARWRELDRAVRLTNEYGLRAMIDIAFWAPRWASVDPAGERGRSEVDPKEFAAFSAAVARRYSGEFTVPVDVAPAPPNEDEDELDKLFGDNEPEPEGPQPATPAPPLPRVDVFTLWNEPNHTGFLRPQWVRDGNTFRPRSPEIYRAMVLAAYPAVKAASPQATVLVGATSGSGDHSGRGVSGVAPLRFLRELACVDAKLKPLTTPACANFRPLPGDAWSHHPYSMTNTPDTPSGKRRPDSVSMADLPRLASTLDRLAAAGRIAPALRDIWVTEYGYETNPPSKISRYGVGDQARFLAWGEYLAWRVPQVKSYAQFLLRDLPPGADRVGASLKRPFGEWYSGLEFSDGKPKLAMEAFRSGLFVERLRGRRLRFWGRLRLDPGPRTVTVEMRRTGGSPWVALTTLARGKVGAAKQVTVDGRGVLHRTASRAPRGRAVRFRLRIEGGGGTRLSPSVTAVDPRPDS
ncbi:MAG: hypothetical protein AVDCRST_MAG30-437 [uncultured Solirubrobacteraceae bacterium]|uniref:Glycoside hydrolase family 5 domain-containing protein n=1 Tax=uncultured Solirubrobacteraceae bacterium TaxID=1162706 RepID=A0A6J4RRE8_9ACTN|nr:MAG: hypothetical protein AVDCRST_MAG30-437 [uncultured Solirubrobacteraceae bacterium]